MRPLYRDSTICGALRDLVAFVQFKKREKNPWRSVNFSKERNKKPCSFKVAYLFHRTSCSNFFLKSTMLNAQKDLQRSHSFMVNVLIWQFNNSNCSFFFYLGFLLRTFTIHKTAAKGGGYLFNSSLYYSYPLCRHLNISRVTTAENSPLHVASSRSRTENLSTSH